MRYIGVMKILDFPTIRQSTTFTCSCSSMQACLCYYGFDYREEQIRRLMRIDRNTREIHPRKMVRVIKKLGLDAAYMKLALNDLIAHIDNDVPVIVGLQAWSESKKPNYNLDNDGHYVVAIGYSEACVFFSDPASFYKTYLSYAELEERWHDGDKFDKSGKEIWDYSHMGIVVWGKKPVYRSDKIIHMD